MKIFILESPSPNDLLDDVNESTSLVNISKMFEHKACSFFIKNKDDLNNTLNYVADINESNNNDIFCYHFSFHGNDKGIAIGPDFLTWSLFTESIKPILKNKNLEEKSILIISSCGANKQKITNEISSMYFKRKENIYPPSYIFVYDESELNWSDALLSWTILYYKLRNLKEISIENRYDLQKLLKNMKEVEFGKLIYFRWDKDKQKYLRFNPK